MTHTDGQRPTVLITGAGGAAIAEIIRSLQARGLRVLTADMDKHAPGLFLSDGGYVIPAGKAPSFPAAIRSIIRKEGVGVLVPLVDEELLASADLAGDVEVILPRREFISTCLDKLALMNELARLGLPCPATRQASEGPGDLRFPLIMKPRTGRGSRGVLALSDPQALTNALAVYGLDAEGMLLQELIDGPEYTISVVVWRDGAVQAVVPKLVHSKIGITKIAESRRDDEIDRVCREIQSRMEAYGPFNVQLRKDSKGRIYIFEINPRFSTTLSLTSAAGVDEVGILVDQALGCASAAPCGWREGVVLLRRYQDTFWDADALGKMAPTHWTAI